jgi:hypothetical protein
MFGGGEGKSVLGEGMGSQLKDFQSKDGHMDFDDEDANFDEWIIRVQIDHKVFTTQIKIHLSRKAILCKPLCRMISMPIVRPALLLDVKKMYHNFQMGYREGDKVFYVSITNNKGIEKYVTFELMTL